jgi:hypothetical protein
MEHLGTLDKYSPTTLQGLNTHLSDGSIAGLAKQVKGTLFEQRALQMYNHGDLPMPDGAAHAELAHSTVQPGWDMRFVDAHGATVGVVQAKATDNVGLIMRHLERYPQYPDVVTTHEVAGAAAHHAGAAGHITDSGVNNQDLLSHVQGPLGHLTDAHVLHEWFPEFAVITVAIGASIKLRSGATRSEVRSWAATQLATAGVANIAGLAAMVATGTIWIRPVAAISSRLGFGMALERGRVADRLGTELREMQVGLEQIAERYGTALGARPA